MSGTSSAAVGGGGWGHFTGRAPCQWAEPPQIRCPVGLTGTSGSRWGGLGGSRTPRGSPQPCPTAQPLCPPASPTTGAPGARCPLCPPLALFLPRSPGGGGGAQLVQEHPPPRQHLLAQPRGGRAGRWGRGSCPGLRGAGRGGRGGFCPWQVLRRNVGQALIFSGAGGAAAALRHSCLLRWNANCSLRGWPPPPPPDPHDPPSPPHSPPTAPQHLLPARRSKGHIAGGSTAPRHPVPAPGMREVQNTRVAERRPREATGHV